MLSMKPMSSGGFAAAGANIFANLDMLVWPSAKLLRTTGSSRQKRGRQATHDLDCVHQTDSGSEASDIDGDSWYYSDDGTISQAYWTMSRDMEPVV